MELLAQAVQEKTSSPMCRKYKALMINKLVKAVCFPTICIISLSACTQQAKCPGAGNNITTAQANSIAMQEKLQNLGIKSSFEAQGISLGNTTLCQNDPLSNRDGFLIYTTTTIVAANQAKSFNSCAIFAKPSQYYSNLHVAQFQFEKVVCLDQDSKPYYLKASDYNESVLGFISNYPGSLLYSLEPYNKNCDTTKTGDKVFIYFYKPVTSFSTSES